MDWGSFFLGFFTCFVLFLLDIVSVSRKRDDGESKP